MGVYSTAINALATRLTDAQATGKKLNGVVVSVYVGPRSMVEKNIDTPSIVIELAGIREEYGVAGSLTRIAAEIDLNLWVKYPIEDTEASDTYAGLITLIEKIGDVLNETDAQVLDPRLGANSRRPIAMEMGDFETYGDRYIFQLKVKITTPNFLINSRSS